MAEASKSTEPAPVEVAPPAEETPPPARAGVIGWVDRHPILFAFVVLAIGMVAILLYTSRDVGLQPSQLLAMVVATVALAGACAWIISWD